MFFWITAAGRRRDGVSPDTLVGGCGGFAERLGQAFPPADPEIVVINVVRERKNVREGETQKLLPIDQPKIFVRTHRVGEERSFVDLQNDLSVPSAGIGRHGGKLIESCCAAIKRRQMSRERYTRSDELRGFAS